MTKEEKVKKLQEAEHRLNKAFWFGRMDDELEWSLEISSLENAVRDIIEILKDELSM